MLSPLLYSLFNSDWVATHASNLINKFVEDITVVGLITNNDETAYWEEVRALGERCQENYVSLIVNRTFSETLKPSQTFTDVQLRASCRAVSPPGTATAPPSTARHSRGWCGLHNT